MRHADDEKGDEESGAEKGAGEVGARVEVMRHGREKERANSAL